MRRVSIQDISEPVYYLGWIAQLGPFGFYVYSRRDSRKASDTYFSNLDSALYWIEEEVDGEELRRRSK